MWAGREAMVQRETRLALLCRDGFHLVERDTGYRDTVLARLQPELETPPNDLWTAIPWTWSILLGSHPPVTGALMGSILDAVGILREWFAKDEPFEALQAAWNSKVGDRLALGSTLRSHPFPDIRTWFIRPQFAGSSSTPRGL